MFHEVMVWNLDSQGLVCSNEVIKQAFKGTRIDQSLFALRI